MKQNLITDVIQGMLPYLNNAQTERLQEVLQYTLFDYEVTKIKKDEELSEQNLVESFLSAKRIEGCSEKTLKYYNATIQSMLDGIGKSIKYIVTDDIRCYLTEYQAKKKSSKVTIDNIRRILSSFFSWLEDEDYILKSPVRRIHKVKTGTNIKETYSDEALELMRDNCTELRDLAMIDMLASTGMRVGEMVLLNREQSRCGTDYKKCHQHRCHIHQKQSASNIQTGMTFQYHGNNVSSAAGCSDIKQNRRPYCRQKNGKYQFQHRLISQRRMHGINPRQRRQAD